MRRKVPEDGDGCSSECAVEEPTPACGDGNLDAGEECDDANTRDGDGCDASCRHEVSDPRCGDGRVDDGEECDDANTRDGDGCDAACQVEVSGPACGDGVRDGDEECDDANTRDGDGCSAECLTESTRVVLNEIVAGSTDGSPDAVELFNPGATTVRLDGWYFTDEDPTHVFSFAPDTAIAPGSYLVVVRDDLGGGFTFGLGADDALSLFDSTSVLIDSTDWADGDAPIDGSWARSPNGSGSWVARVTASLGRSND